MDAFLILPLFFVGVLVLKILRARILRGPQDQPFVLITLAALMTLEPLTLPAQAAGVNNSGSFQPVIVGGSGAVSVKPGEPHPRKTKPAPIDASKIERKPGSIAGQGAAKADYKLGIARPSLIQTKLRELDRQARRGNLSLESYRERRDAILTGY